MLYGSVSGIPRPISRLVLGSVFFSDESDQRLKLTFQLLDAFHAIGGTMIDTAFSYGGGRCERAIGAWLAARGSRSEMQILTKGAHPSATEPRRVTPNAIRSDLSASLERLRSDYVDLYLLHRDDPDVPVGPIVEALNEHHAAGRVRAFGGSNWTPQRIDEANAYAAARGLQGFAASSPNLSLAVPKEPRWPGCLYADDATRAWHHAQQFPLFSWSSQAGGFFSGRFAPGQIDDPDMVRVYDSADNWERYHRAAAIATQRNCSVIQIALAWVLAQPFPVFPLIGPQSIDELNSSVAALEIELTPEEAQWLDLRTS
jgi:aryl-alcohol dehydrogenase-like predicted oxidoreductase